MLYNQDPNGFGTYGINLLDRSANYDVADVAQPRNVSKSQHDGNDNSESERNSTIVLKLVE
jgi:hypothetical protein